MRLFFGRLGRLGLVLASLALLHVSVAARGGGLAVTPWPMSDHDVGHSGRSDRAGIDAPTLMWKRPLITAPFYGEMGTGMSIAADGTVYAPVSGSLLALEYPAASTRWRIDKNHSTSVPAISANGTFYWGFDDSFGVISPTGQIMGGGTNLTGSGVFAGSPVIAPDGTVYVHKHGLWSWSPDGDLNWVHPFGGFGENTSPALGPDGTIYTITAENGGELVAFEADGDVKWSKYFSAGGSAVVGADGTIYVGSNNGSLNAFNPDGSLKWTFESDAYTKPALTSDARLASDGTIYFSAAYGPDFWQLKSNMYALNADGSLKWKYPASGALAGYIYPGPVDASNHLVACGYHVMPCYRFSPQGEVVWQYDPGGMVRTTPLIPEDGVLWIMTTNGVLHALADSAKPIMRLSPERLNVCGADPADLAVTITAGELDAQWTASLPAQTSWLGLDKQTGATSSALTLNVNPSGMSAGRHTAMLRLSLAAPDVPNREMDIPVTFETSCVVRLPLISR